MSCVIEVTVIVQTSHLKAATVGMKVGDEEETEGEDGESEVSSNWHL